MHITGHLCHYHGSMGSKVVTHDPWTHPKMVTHLTHDPFQSLIRKTRNYAVLPNDSPQNPNSANAVRRPVLDNLTYFRPMAVAYIYIYIYIYTCLCLAISVEGQ